MDRLSAQVDGAGLGQETHALVAVTEVGRELGDSRSPLTGHALARIPQPPHGPCSRTHLARTTGVTELLRARYEHATSTLRARYEFKLVALVKLVAFS